MTTVTSALVIIIFIARTAMAVEDAHPVKHDTSTVTSIFTVARSAVGTIVSFARGDSVLEQTKLEKEEIQNRMIELDSKNKELELRIIKKSEALTAIRNEFTTWKREANDREQKLRQNLEENDHQVMMVAYIGGSVMLVIGIIISVSTWRVLGNPCARVDVLGVREYPMMSDSTGNDPQCNIAIENL